MLGDPLDVGYVPPFTASPDLPPPRHEADLERASQ